MVLKIFYYFNLCTSIFKNFLVIINFLHENLEGCEMIAKKTHYTSDNSFALVLGHSSNGKI